MLLILIVIFLISVPLGCGNSDRGEETAPAVISVWYSLSGAQADELLKQCSQIMSAHPDLVIKADYLAESEFVEKTWQLQAGGEGPEIFVTSGSIMDQLFSKGALSPVLAQSDHLFQPAKVRYSSHEQPYALPLLTDVPLLFYRTDLVEAPVNLNDLLARRTAIYAEKLNISLLSGWWKAEGGGFVSGQNPMINTANNLAFLNHISTLRAEGIVKEDPQAVEKFMKGEENYLLAWGSTVQTLTANQVSWGCVSFASLLGDNAKAVTGRSVCLANSSTKSAAGLHSKIQLVEEELLKPQVAEALSIPAKLLPANDQYYAGQQNQFIKNEVAKALTTAWGIEVSSLELKMLPILENAFQDSIFGGGSAETALEQAQQQLTVYLSSQK